jgi:hypothetical protein
MKVDWREIGIGAADLGIIVVTPYSLRGSLACLVSPAYRVDTYNASTTYSTYCSLIVQTASSCQIIPCSY